MDEKTVGGKAYNLNILTKNGINVPKWGVVNSSDDDFVIEEDKLYAVRSSAVGEDGSGNSFAGQMESYLYVKPQDIKNRIQDVINSASSERIKFYREQNGLSNDDIKVGVIIQEMINSEVSGVAFSSNPITGKRNEVVISSVFGLGEGLVSGELNADTFIVEVKKLQKILLKNHIKLFLTEKTDLEQSKNLTKNQSLRL